MINLQKLMRKLFGVFGELFCLAMMPPPEKHLYVKTLLDNNRMTATEWSERANARTHRAPTVGVASGGKGTKGI